jgi:hypothetical protein
MRRPPRPVFRTAASQRAALGAALALVAALALACLAAAPGTVRGAVLAWTVSASPLTLVEGRPTDVVLTVNPGSQQIGCLIVTVPGGFSVAAASITSVPAGAVWNVDVAGSGPTTVSFYTSQGNWRLVAGEVGRFTIRVTALSAPLAAWSTAGYQQGLPPRGPLGPPLLPLQAFVIVPAPTPTPTPRATPDPTPEPTPEPTPSPQPTAPGTGQPATPSPVATTPPTARPGGPTLTPPTPGRGAGGAGTGSGGTGPGSPLPTGLDVRALPEQGRVQVANVGFTGGLGVYAWAVPGLFLGLPGLLILLVVGAQLLLAGMFIPIVRRQMGARRPKPARPPELG